MIDDYITAQQLVIERIRQVLIESIGEDYLSFEFYEELYESSNRVIASYLNKSSDRRDIELSGIANLDVIELSVKLRELMESRQGGRWQAMRMTYTKGGAVEIGYDYGKPVGAL